MTDFAIRRELPIDLLAPQTAGFHNSLMLTFRRPHRLATVLAVTFALLANAACTTNPATGEQSFTAFMSAEEEKRVGAEEHPKITAQFGGEYTEGSLDDYVDELGVKLLRVSETPNEDFTFTVLDSDVVNAFALPGGYVYVSRGLVALAENEAELAGVLGHEIGHVTARHSAQRYSSAVAANIGLSIIGIIGSVAGVPSGANDLLSTGATAVLQGYSREQELQADMLGVRYLSRAGYDPDAMRSFFEKMAENDELRARITGKPTSEETFNFASSHPRTSDRIQQAIDLTSDARIANPAINRERFLAEIDGMIFGDSPAQGLRRGRTFSHGELGITFTVPPDYLLNNQPTAVTASNPNGGRFIFDMADATVARETRDLRLYLTTAWGKNLNLSGVEQITIDGMEAWTGRTRGRTREGEREIRLVAIRGTSDRIYRMAFITPPDQLAGLQEELQRTTYSFRRLSASEIAALKPLRIRTRFAGSATTTADFARQMAVEQFPEDWFRLINANALADGLQGGEAVKVVVE